MHFRRSTRPFLASLWYTKSFVSVLCGTPVTGSGSSSPFCSKVKRSTSFFKRWWHCFNYALMCVIAADSGWPFPSSSGRLRVERQSQDSVTLSWSSGRHRVCVWHFPFRLEILCEDEVMVTFNSKGKLWFETLQDPPRWGPVGVLETNQHTRKKIKLNFLCVFFLC